ncbi:MAG TPA: alpha/beta hydrolase [Candidatus Binatia bacterium]|nr:alpha/beta hydrolase [Candidatus Binatia bacterium]
MVDRHFTSRGVRLHVLDHGGSGLPVVLLHGGSAHARWWDFVVPHLGGGLRIYALDLRGHGDSDWAADGAYQMADYAADLARLIAVFGLERPALVGHSLGSFIALRHAIENPRGLSALVMVDGRASFGASGSRYMKLLGMLAPAEYDRIEEAIERFRPLPKETIASAEILAHVARHSFRYGDGRWKTKFDRASFAGHESFDLEERLGDLECPVLFVRGEHSPVVSSARIAKLAAACRDGRFVEIPGCHHHLPIDRPDVLGREIGRFLREIARRAQSP